MSYYRTATYRRCIWPIGNQRNLERLVADCHNLQGPREFTIGTKIVKALHIRHIPGESGVYLHLTSYEPERPVSVIPHDGDETGEQAPPQEGDYLRSDLAALIRENHVIIMTSGLSEKFLTRYLFQFIESVNHTDGLTSFSILPIIDRDLSAEIRQNGVKGIKLKTTYRNATASYERHEANGTSSPNILKRMLNSQNVFQISELSDEDRRRIAQSEHVHVELSISLKGTRGELEEAELEAAALERIALQTADSENENADDSIEFDLGKGRVIKASQLKLSKNYRVIQRGSSFERNDAWAKLNDYYDTLREEGRLQD